MNKKDLVMWLAKNVSVEDFNLGNFNLPIEATDWHIHVLTPSSVEVGNLGVFGKITALDVCLAIATLKYTGSKESNADSKTSDFTKYREILNNDGVIIFTIDQMEITSDVLKDHGWTNDQLFNELITNDKWSIKNSFSTQPTYKEFKNGAMRLAINSSYGKPNNKPLQPNNTNPLYSATNILKVASDNIGDRASKRDTEAGRSMAATIRAFNGMYGTELTEEQGWMFMVFLKAARAKGGDFRDDDYIDGASYFALAGECAASERD